jgi:TonB family protein
MKTCSTCGNSFSDDLSFCLQDGTVLKSRVTSDLSAEPTEIFRVDTEPDHDISSDPTVVDNAAALASVPASQKVFQMKALEPASRMGCVLSIGQVAAALVIVVGIGFVGLLYLRSSTQVAGIAPTNTVSSNTISTAPMSDPANSTANARATQLPTPATVAAGDVTGKAVDLPKPAYPPAARSARIEGSVQVRILVDEKGLVTSAYATEGHQLLRTAAEQAARSARFDPMVVKGSPVKFTGTIRYNFVL